MSAPTTGGATTGPAPIPDGYRNVAYVQRRNGAWMIQWVYDQAKDQAEDEQFSCAASLTVAKRVAREGAAAAGCGPGFRWVDAGYAWVLYAPDNSWDYDR